MAYSRPSFPAGREVLKNYHEQQLLNFKLDNTARDLTIYPPSRVPWKLHRAYPDHYQKKHSEPPIDIIYKNDEFDSFIWHANTKHLREATRFGLLKTQSLTSQVIGAIGRYHTLILERVEAGV